MANETQIPKAPPAPEVALRTLSSDAKSIAAGEVDPQPTLVTPPPVSNMGGLITAEKVEETEGEEGGAPKQKSTVKKMLLWASIVILILAIIAVVVFWLLPKLSGGSNVEVTVPSEKP